MKSYRENPEGEVNQLASAQNARDIFAAQMQFPRKKHSHRCLRCGAAVYCYKKHCTKPQKVLTCPYCK